jgi:hypothetical protein
MHTIPIYAAQQMARYYTRDRIREAEAHNAARTARTAARERRSPERRPQPDVGRWRFFTARTTTA